MTIISTCLAAVLSTMAAQNPVQTTQPPPQPAPPPAQGQQPQAFRRPPEVMNNLQGFNIVLLVGESQSSGPSIEDVPAAARKALADMKEFLPFKHYRVLDSQWTSCCSNPGGSWVQGRLQGLTAAHSGNEMRLVPRPYTFKLNASADSRLKVIFTLTGDAISGRVEPPSTNSARGNELEKRLTELRKEQDKLDDEILRRTRELNSKHPDVQSLVAQRDRVHMRMAETVNQLASERVHTEVDRSNRSLIDNSFTMEVGETVVVGTSRLGGDKALIAIVTAVRKGAR